MKQAHFTLELATPDGERRARFVGSKARGVPEAPFVSERFGDPGYAVLRLDAGDEALRGGTGGAELGAFRSLASGQRLANLVPTLGEYLAWGVKAGIFVMGQESCRGAGYESPRSGRTRRADTQR